MDLERLVLRLEAQASQFTRDLDSAGMTVDEFKDAVKQLNPILNAAADALRLKALANRLEKDTMDEAAASVERYVRAVRSVPGFIRPPVAPPSAPVRNPAPGFIFPNIPNPPEPTKSPLEKMQDMLVSGLKASVIYQTVRAVGELKDAFANTVVASLSLASSFEMTRTTFQVLLGDVEKGNRIFADMLQLDLKTSLSIHDLAQGATVLLGAGFQDNQIIPALSRLGDIAAGDSTKFQRLVMDIERVAATGRVTFRDLRNFATVGITAADFAKTLGVTTEQFIAMTHAGKVSGQVVYDTFNRLTDAGGRFYGMNEKILHAAGGAYKNLVESVQQLLAAIGGEALEKFGVAEGMLSLSKSIQENIAGWADAAGRFFEKLNAIYTVLSKISSIIFFDPSGLDMSDHLPEGLRNLIKEIDEHFRRITFRGGPSAESVMDKKTIMDRAEESRILHEAEKFTKFLGPEPPSLEGLSAADRKIVQGVYEDARKKFFDKQVSRLRGNATPSGISGPVTDPDVIEFLRQIGTAEKHGFTTQGRLFKGLDLLNRAFPESAFTTGAFNLTDPNARTGLEMVLGQFHDEVMKLVPTPDKVVAPAALRDSQEAANAIAKAQVDVEYDLKDLMQVANDEAKERRERLDRMILELQRMNQRGGTADVVLGEFFG